MQQLYLEFGDTQIDLNGLTTRLASSFVPATAGDEDESVTERIELMFEATDVGQTAPIQEINRWLKSGKEMRNLTASKEFVYLYFAETETDTAWRSRVLGGKVILDGNYGFWKQGGVTRFDLIVERAPYWEGAQTAVPLSNGNGTDVTAPTGLDFYWIGDGTGSSPNKRDNWFKIDAEDIEGDLPGPVEVHFTPGGSVATGKVVMGMYPDVMGLGQPPTVIELDDWTGGTKTVDTEASDGYYLSTAIGTTLATLAVVNPLDLSVYYGTWWRVILRIVSTAPQDESWFQLKLQDGFSTTVVLGETPLTRIDTTGLAAGTQLFDLGMIRLPPYTQFPSVPAVIRASLWGYSPAAGTVKLDSLLLIPADWQAYLKGQGGIGSADPLYHFVERWGDDEQSYFDNNGQALFVFLERLGSGIYLTPGYDNYLVMAKLQVIGATWANGIYAAEHGELWMYYRPRRRNL